MGLPNNVFDYEYTYDSLHRLKTELFKDSAEAVIPASFPPVSYTYDPIGNIASKVSGPTTLGYMYHPTKKHAVSSISVNGTPYAFDYDDNGNMINGYDLTNPGSIVSRSLTWNADNMPTVVTRNGISTTLSYDGEGTRVKKVGSSGTTYYIGEHFEVSNNDPTKYIFAGNLRIAKVGAASGTYYFHKDYLGSSSAMTTDAGSVQEETNYMPFGEQREHAGLTLSNYKFTDQELDPETGLYNYGARLYDTVTGRFISPDTIVPYPREPQSLNRYSYARNNPLIYVDPTGHYDEDDALEDFYGYYEGDYSDDSNSNYSNDSGNLSNNYSASSSNSISRSFDSLVQSAGNFSAGYGDTITSLFGLTYLVGVPSMTEYIRQQNDFDSVVEKNSGAYCGGKLAGYLWGAAAVGAGSLNAGSQTVLYSGEGALNVALAEKGSGLILAETIGGKVLNYIDKNIYTLPQKVWDMASGIFAANAKDEVQIFLRDALSEGVYNRVERPILSRQNDNVLNSQSRNVLK